MAFYNFGCNLQCEYARYPMLCSGKLMLNAADMRCILSELGFDILQPRSTAVFFLIAISITLQFVHSMKEFMCCLHAACASFQSESEWQQAGSASCSSSTHSHNFSLHRLLCHVIGGSVLERPSTGIEIRGFRSSKRFPSTMQSHRSCSTKHS